MRLLKIDVPEVLGDAVVQTAFAVRLKKVSLHKVESHHADGTIRTNAVIDIEASTPSAKEFAELLLSSDFFDRETCSLMSREARSIVSRQRLSDLTVPLVQPPSDVLEELLQFSRITFGFVGRSFLAGCLLAFGLIQFQVLLIAAGLLFLPLLPLLLAASFGVLTRQWLLVKQGIGAFLTIIALLFLAGLFVGVISSPPLRYTEFNSFGVSFLISLAVGIAAGLAFIDDVGRRELIGLAASSQIAIVPVWFGICSIFGFPLAGLGSDISGHIVSFLINSLTLIVTSGVVYFFAYRKNLSDTEL
jgi:hypothetical protein